MIEYLFFVIGIALLLKGADYLVEGSSSLAKKLGVSTLVIGLTIVAFGTSTPELVVNIIAALSRNSDISFGNIIGSNISNTLLILGITGIITRIKVKHSTTWKEIPFSLLAVAVLFVLANTLFLDNLQLGYLYRFEGMILILFFTIFLYYVFELSKKDKKNKDSKIKVKELSYTKITLYIIGGLIALYLGGKWTVEGAVSLARFFGMSEYFISLTIVAVGTSLPELITSVFAALKKDVDLAVGNVIGSNIFNIFWVLGITSIITPIKIPAFATYDLIFLLLITFMLFIFMFIGRKHELEKWQGITFVLLYIGYIIHLLFR